MSFARAAIGRNELDAEIPGTCLRMPGTDHRSVLSFNSSSPTLPRSVE